MELISDNERLEFQPTEDCTIYFRRIPQNVANRILSKNEKQDFRNTQRNEISSKSMKEIYDFGVIDWEGVTFQGEEAECTPDNIMRLPPEILDELFVRMRGMKEKKI